jgi:hypothetical protein
MKASRLHITRLVLATVLILAAVVLAQTSAAARVKTVQIINIYSHHPVDIVPGGRAASTQPYANAFLWKNSISDSQWFDLIYSVGGKTNTFKIRNRLSGLCLMLDFRDLPYRNGTRVIQYDCNVKKQSKWWYRVRVEGVPAPPGERQSDYRYMLLVKNDYTGKCLDADNGGGGEPPRGAVLQQWDCFEYSDDWNVGNQLWRDY